MSCSCRRRAQRSPAEDCRQKAPILSVRDGAFARKTFSPLRGGMQAPGLKPEKKPALDCRGGFLIAWRTFYGLRSICSVCSAYPVGGLYPRGVLFGTRSQASL